jgi:hypothetical protein
VIGGDEYRLECKRMSARTRTTGWKPVPQKELNMMVRWQWVLTAVLAAAAWALPDWGAALKMPVFVKAMGADGAAGTAVVVVIPTQSRLEQELGLAGQTLNPGGAKLLTADGSGVACQIDPVRVEGELGAQLSFKLASPLGAGETGQYWLEFDPTAVGSIPAKSIKAVNPDSVGIDYATTELGQTWDFDEGAKPVFSGAWHATVREESRNGGFLWATADGKYSSPVIGAYKGKIDGERYYKVVARARRRGPTPSSILVNGKTSLVDANGHRELKQQFDIYSADMRGRPGWGKKVDELMLRWGYGLGTPTADDEIQIDWLRIVAPRAVEAWAGPIEGKQGTGLKAYGQWFRPDSSTAYFYVLNEGSKGVDLTKLWVDGRVERDAPWPLEKSRRAMWFDILPSHLEPGQIAQVRVNLRDTVRQKPVSLTVLDETGRLRASAVIAPEAPRVRFSDIDFSEDGTSAYLYVKGVKGTIAKVFVDGADATGQADLSAGKGFDGTAMAVVRFKEALKPGSRHLYEVRTSEGGQGGRAIYLSRTLPGRYIRGTYGVPRPEEYVSHGLNLLVGFRFMPPTTLDALHAAGMNGGGVPQVGGSFDRAKKAFVPLDVEATTKNVESSKGNPGLGIYGLPDEPDGKDYYSGQGVGAQARVYVAARKLFYALDPATPIYLQIDNTYRDKNYQVYSEIADYAASHIYNLGKPRAAEGWLGQMRSLRAATSPQPYLWVTDFYPLAVDRKFTGRFPTTGEMQWQLLETLAGGAKGFVHYIHSGSSGGRGGAGRDKALWDSMTPLHQQMAAAGKVAVRSTPVDWASADTKKVRVAALLGDPGNILVVVTNATLVSAVKGFTAPSVEHVKISVKLPDWARVDQAVEIGPGGELKPVPLEKREGGVAWQSQEIDVGAVYWLRSQK